MGKMIVVLGLQKAAIVLHALAFRVPEGTGRKEALALVDAVTEAIKLLESQQ